mmetsp:Transcript_16397/g.20451  ORF Transcript_16397/g.20451 Transcript_16397/m.20451 type:complete len:89 (-) Transcript_16397:1124-1390(-)
MRAPTIMRQPPVAQGGILASKGAKNIERKKNRPQNTAASPVLAPASTPAADSMKEVTGDSPNKDPKAVARASAVNAQRLLGKSPFSST